MTTARASAPCSTPSPPSIRGATTSSTGAAPRPPGSRRSARRTDLVGMADEPLDIRWTPTFLRAFGGAMLSSPGPLDKGQTAFFAITPMPDDWTRGAARVVPARGQRPDAPAPVHPRGDPGPLPPGRLREPLPVAGPGDLRERAVRRGLGRLRDAGDDGRRVSARTTRRCCSPTGSSTCARSPTRSSTRGSTSTA